MSVNSNDLACLHGAEENQQLASTAYSSNGNSLIPAPSLRAEIPLALANEWLQAWPQHSEQDVESTATSSSSATFSLQRQLRAVALNQQYRMGATADVQKQLSWQKGHEENFKKSAVRVELWYKDQLRKIREGYNPSLVSDFEKKLNALEEELPVYLETLQSKGIFFSRTQLKIYRLDPKQYEELTNCLHRYLAIHGHFGEWAGTHVSPQEEGAYLNKLQVLCQRSEKVAQKIKEIEAIQQGILQGKNEKLFNIKKIQQQFSPDLFEIIYKDLVARLSHAMEIKNHLETCIGKKEIDFINQIRDCWVADWKMLSRWVESLIEAHGSDAISLLEAEEAQPQLEILSNLSKKRSLLSEHRTLIDNLDAALQEFEQKTPHDEESINARQIERQNFRTEKIAAEEAAFLKEQVSEEQQDKEKLAAAQQSLENLQLTKNQAEISHGSLEKELRILEAQCLELNAATHQTPALEKQQSELLNSIRETEEKLQVTITDHEAAMKKMKEQQSLIRNMILPTADLGPALSELCVAVAELNSLKTQQEAQLHQKKAEEQVLVPRLEETQKSAEKFFILNSKAEELRLQLSQASEKLKELEDKIQTAQQAYSEIQKMASENVLKRQQQKERREIEKKQNQVKNKLASYLIYLQSSLSTITVLSKVMDEIKNSERQLIQHAHLVVNLDFNHLLAIQALYEQKKHSLALLDKFLKAMRRRYDHGRNLLMALPVSDDPVAVEIRETLQEEQQSLGKTLDEAGTSFITLRPLMTDLSSLKSQHEDLLCQHLGSAHSARKNQLLKIKAAKSKQLLLVLEAAFDKATPLNRLELQDLLEEVQTNYADYKDAIQKLNPFYVTPSSDNQQEEAACHEHSQALQVSGAAGPMAEGDWMKKQKASPKKLILNLKLEDLVKNCPDLAYLDTIKQKRRELGEFEQILNDFRKLDGRWTRLLGQIREALNQILPGPVQQRRTADQSNERTDTEEHSTCIRVGQSQEKASDRRHGSNFYDAALSDALNAHVKRICEEIKRQQAEEEAGFQLQFDQEMLVFRTNFLKAKAERSEKQLQDLETLENQSQSQNRPDRLAQRESLILSKIRRKKMALPQCTQIQRCGNGNFLPKSRFRSVETVYLNEEGRGNQDIMVAYYFTSQSETWNESELSLEKFDEFLIHQGLVLKEGAIESEQLFLDKVLSLFGLSKVDSRQSRADVNQMANRPRLQAEPQASASSSHLS